eukprot:CAMPEP_0185796176 /NCGR_PEP_ID=MMETSP1174-20130828/160939_1 /TAXON_ID=35687 /ORGANISM="Dictyocha speculum, Strain CCMP1381" /LENGTH=185 /DNA_ID=CAMNT_0028491519 /DNA_START=368 /DNA_END=925 /DNA_ORIENTATION=+
MISRSLQEKEEGPGVEEAKASDMANEEEHAEKDVNYEIASDERDSVDSEALSSEEEKEMRPNDKFGGFKEKEGFDLLKVAFKKKERRLNEAKMNAIKENNSAVVKLDDVTKQAAVNDLRSVDGDVAFLQEATVLDTDKAKAAEVKAKVFEDELKRATDMLRELNGLEEQVEDEDKVEEPLTQKKV